MFQYVRSLLHLRKEHPALTKGALVQFPPLDEVYAYVRTSGKEKILVLANNSAEAKSFKLSLVKDQLRSARELRGLIDGKAVSLDGASEIEIAGNSDGIYEVGASSPSDK